MTTGHAMLSALACVAAFFAGRGWQAMTDAHRAWRDTIRAVPMARSAFLSSLGTAARRVAITVGVLAALGAFSYAWAAGGH